MNRPALATASTVLGILVLLGGKAATTSGSTALAGPSGPSGPSMTSAPATAQGNVTGPVVSTPYGPVQVRIDVTRGRITDVQAIQLPAGGQSGQIADYAAPILRTEALAAQGAGIQSVSGATYTSQGYASSLQAALDRLAAPQQRAAAASHGLGGQGRRA